MSEGFVRYADLHLHTVHSDGTRFPREILDLAVRHRLEIVAISDHDNVAAYHEMREYAREKGILLVPAAELSCEHRGIDVHILAYAFDPSDQRIAERLASFREVRRRRGELMVQKLRDLGYDISFQRVDVLRGNGALGRPHVARALMEIGAVSSFEEAFATLIGSDGPAYVPKERFQIDEVVSLIRGAGGLTSVAHPTLYPEDRRTLVEVLEQGVDAVEVFHPKIDTESRMSYEVIAARMKKSVTGGSDDHGAHKTAETIGTVRVPEDRIREILARME